MDNGQKVAELLRQAAQSIETAMVLLDTGKTTCTCCSAPRWHNQPHARTYQRFSDVPTRLVQAAAELEEQSKTLAQSRAIEQEQ